MAARVERDQVPLARRSISSVGPEDGDEIRTELRRTPTRARSWTALVVATAVPDSSAERG